MYLYLVDDLTGKPVQEEGWPIEVNKPSELARKLLPLMRVGVRGMSIYNCAVDVLKMFGIGFVVDAAKIPKWLLDDVQTMVDDLKQKTSVEDFDVVHDVLQEGNDKNKDQNIRHACGGEELNHSCSWVWNIRESDQNGS